MRLSNLPPGCTNKMIEDQCGEPKEEIQIDEDGYIIGQNVRMSNSLQARKERMAIFFRKQEKKSTVRAAWVMKEKKS